MLGNLPEYRGPPKQSWNSHIRRLEMLWAAYRVPPHDTINRRNALLLSLARQAVEMASHLFGEAGQALSYKQVKAECEMLFRPAYESQTLKQAFKDSRQHLHEPIQAYISTKCALYREAYGHKDLELLIDELNRGIRNANVKRIMMEHEFTSVPEYTRKTMFVVTLVTKQLKEGVALVDAADGLTGSASVQLPQYDDTEPMEIGALAVGLHQMGKVAPEDASKTASRCYQSQGLGHRARECPSPQNANQGERHSRPRRDQTRCECCHYGGHTAADCKADWGQVKGRRRAAGKASNSSKSNSQVAYLEGGALGAPQPAAAPSTAGNQEAAPQFGTIPARFNMIGGSVEPNRIGLGFGLNQMEPEYVQPTNIAEPTPLQHLSLNMMVPAGPSPPTREVNPVTPKQMRGVTPVTPSEGREVLTSTTKEMYGATTVATTERPGVPDKPARVAPATFRALGQHPSPPPTDLTPWTSPQPWKKG